MDGRNNRKKKKSMHPYIPHLLNDIRAAHRVEDLCDRYNEPQTFEEQLEEMERWAAGEFENPEHTFGYYCGLETVNFPPPDQLNDRDIEMVCEAFNKLLFSWNASIDLPDSLPLRLRYKFMVNTLNEGFTPVSCGIIGFDYCTGYAPDCPLGEYCPCLEIWNDDDELTDGDGYSDDLGNKE
jgi:hypothetical protein